MENYVHSLSGDWCLYNSIQIVSNMSTLKMHKRENKKAKAFDRRTETARWPEQDKETELGTCELKTIQALGFPQLPTTAARSAAILSLTVKGQRGSKASDYNCLMICTCYSFSLTHSLLQTDTLPCYPELIPAQQQQIQWSSSRLQRIYPISPQKHPLLTARHFLKNVDHFPGIASGYCERWAQGAFCHSEPSEATPISLSHTHQFKPHPYAMDPGLEQQSSHLNSITGEAKPG